MATSRKASSSPGFPAVVSADAHGDFHLGAVVNGVFIKFASMSQVHAQALAAKAVVIAGDEPAESEEEG